MGIISLDRVHQQLAYHLQLIAAVVYEKWAPFPLWQAQLHDSTIITVHPLYHFHPNHPKALAAEESTEIMILFWTLVNRLSLNMGFMLNTIRKADVIW